MKKSKSKSTDIVTDNIGGFDVFRDVFYPKEIEIHLQELDLIYTVTDPLGIDRESVLLEVRKEDPGSIVCTDSGRIQITIPYTGTIQEFLNRLQMELEGMGYPPAKVAENSAMLNACRTTHIFCRPNCPPGRRTKQENRLVFPSARAAMKKGFRPCRVCLPTEGEPWVWLKFFLPRIFSKTLSSQIM